MKSRTATLCVLAFLTIASCSKGPLPEVYMYGKGRGAGSLGAHTVAKGETLTRIALNYEVLESELAALNNIKVSDPIKVGQRLRIPPPVNYQVRKGDTIYSLSRLFEMAPQDIAALNKIEGPYMLKPGQTVTLSRQKLATMVAQSLSQPPPLLPEPKPYMPQGDVTPQPTTQPSSQTVAKADGNYLKLPENYRGQGADAQAPITQKPTVQIPASATVSGTAVATRQIPVVPAGKFLQPVRGKIIASFGELPDGRVNDGINISAPFGTSVQAAQDGEVAYAGGDLAGYGNLVLIRHRGDYVTVYAHMARITVKKGTMVRLGDQIGTVGQSGAVREPQLHFEIRQGKKTRNPAGLVQPL